MYKTTEKYQLGMESLIDVRTAIMEKLRSARNAETPGTATVIHAYGSTYLVMHDMSQEYGMPENVLLYKVQQMKNFARFKALGETAKLYDVSSLFMINTDNGLWDNRWPDYGQKSSGIRLISMGTDGMASSYRPKSHDEKWCVNSMFNRTVRHPRAIRSYIHPVPVDFPKSAAKTDYISDDKYRQAVAEFCSAFDASKTRMHSEHNTRGL